MKQKIEEKLQAIRLRERGYSVNEIVPKLGVAKSSVSTWVRNVPLSAKARSRLLTRIKLGQFISAENKREKTAATIYRYGLAADRDILGRHLDRTLKRIICALVYWCEGTKNHYRGANFINSDPALVIMFLDLFRQGFNAEEKKLRARIHLHEYHNANRQLRFWSNVTGIPVERFGKPYIKPHTGKRIRKNYPGCITIRYGSNDIARQLLAVGRSFLTHYSKLNG